ncbi:flagellar filament capping protein FliD [Planomicrobium okeanokoites]|uniref:flagellar filament capping protein FliD n=1 Tax=Planomicrobium okeanokoites TaxID=244 RepID=UPI002491F886|nr:flagellar filament capping protein FliD [Planomicrobium okeanokoites]
MRISGLATGMDIDQIVKDLMAAEKMPLDRLTQKKMWTEWQQESYREFNLSLSNLRTSTSSLRFSSAFNAYSATSSNAASLGVSTTASAMTGTYTAEVVSIASAAKVNSSAGIENSPGVKAKSGDQIGTAGTITVTGSGGATATVDVTATMTFSDVAKAIQDSTAASVPALRASFDNTTSRFFIASKGMGVDQNFSMSFSDAALADKIVNNGGTTTAMTTNGQDGSVNFDGIPITGLKSNQTTVNGLTLNLNQVGTSTITVNSDTAKPLESIKSFVENYNKTIADIEAKLIEKRYPDFQPLTDDQKKAMTENEIELWEEKSRSGLLRNDPTLQTALQELRRNLTGAVDDLGLLGNISTLSEIGITTGSYTNGGKLFIDDAKLQKALADKPDEVMNLFTKKTGDLGIAERVYQGLNDAVKSLSTRAGNPGSFIDNSTLSKSIKRMESDISNWQDKLSRIEGRYWKQFTAMEKAMNQMNSQSMWMQQNMFGGM